MVKQYTKSVQSLILFPLTGALPFPTTNFSINFSLNELPYRESLLNVLQVGHHFGIILTDPSTFISRRVGCYLEITEITYAPADEIMVDSIGLKRFQIGRSLQLNPLEENRANVTLIEENPLDQDQLSNISILVTQVCEAFKGYRRRQSEEISSWYARTYGQPVAEPTQDPPKLPDDPVELSFHVAKELYNEPEQQQMLLEMTNTQQRLERELELLYDYTNHWTCCFME